MNTTTKGIIGAVGAAAIGVGAYFGFSGGEDGGNPEAKERWQIACDKFVEKSKNEYNKKFIPDSKDHLFLDTVKSTNKIDLEKEFHLWSWHKYLHLTQKCDKDKKIGGENPYFITNEDMLQIDDLGLVLDHEILHLKLDKQAGSRGELHSKSIENESSTYKTFYSIHMNKVMHSFLKNNAEMKFFEIIEDKIGENDKLDYPIGSLELKAAWINVEAIPSNKRDKYIIVNAKDETKDGKGEEMKVAMVGLHIVGAVQGFQELIWATFEGTDLAPDNLNILTDELSIEKYGFKFEGNYTVKTGDHDFIYAKKGDVLDSKAKDAIDYSKMSKVENEVKVFNPLSDDAFKVYRRVPLGILKSDVNNADHLKVINYLNKQIYHSKVSNYYYNGSIWLERDEQGSVVAKDKFAGSPLLTNVTMESFKQETNCFTCHTTNNSINGNARVKIPEMPLEISYESNLNYSHIYTAMVNSYLANFYTKDKQGQDEIISTNKILFKASPKVREIVEKIKIQNDQMNLSE